MRRRTARCRRTTKSAYRAGAEMLPQTGYRLIEHFVPLAEGEARVMAWRVRRVVERRDRNRGHLGALGDVAAECNIVAVEPKRPKIGGDEVAPPGRQYRQPQARQSCRQAVALRLQRA